MGWIKLDRKIQENELLWATSEPFDCRSAWIDLLMMASHKNTDLMFNRQLVKLKKGQFVTSVRKLGERWNWGEKKVLRYLRILEDTDMIKRDVETVNATLITIINYGKYQDVRNTNDHTDGNTHDHTNNHTNDHTDGSQSRIYKNNKNIKKEKKSDSAPEREPTAQEEEDDWNAL